jgi:hypothetical protein
MPYAMSAPDNPSILAKMRKMRAAGDVVPANLDEFVKVAAAACMEDRRRLKSKLLARMAVLRAAGDVSVDPDTLIKRAVTSLKAELPGEAVEPITIDTPVAVVAPLVYELPVVTAHHFRPPAPSQHVLLGNHPCSATLQPGDSYKSCPTTCVSRSPTQAECASSRAGTMPDKCLKNLLKRKYYLYQCSLLKTK